MPCNHTTPSHCGACDAIGALVPSKRGYKAPFYEGQPNIDFWREVLVGRTITDLEVEPTTNRIKAFRLDDGQSIQVIMNENGEAVLGIED